MILKHKRKALLFLKILISLGLLGFVISKAGLTTEEGWQALLNTVRGANLLYVFLSLVVGVGLILLSAWKWRILLQSKGIHVSLFRLFSFSYIGRFFNLFLPTSVGGDIVRVWDLGQHTGQKTEALASVFVERLTGLITLVVVSLLALVAGASRTQPPVVIASLIFVAVLVMIILWLVLDGRILAILKKLAATKYHFANKLIAKLEQAHIAISAYKNDHKTLAIVFLISAVFYLLAIINVWVTALAFSQNVSFQDMLLAAPVIMLIMNLPVSIGGLGLMEAAYAMTFALYGYSGTLAISTALLMRAKTFINGIIGGLFHLAKLRSNAALAVETAND